MQAVIFAGGLGKRMGIDLPKALIEVKRKTLLRHSVENFIDANVKRFVFMLGYQSEKVIPEIKRLYNDYKIDYSIHLDPYLGCGRIEALKQALNDKIILKKQPSCVHYVDDYITHPFKDIISKSGSEALNLVVSDAVELPYGIVQDNKFIEKPVLPYNSAVGFYIVNPEFYYYVLEDIHKNPEDYVFNVLFSEKKVRIITIPYTTWIPINTKKDLEQANGEK